MSIIDDFKDINRRMNRKPVLDDKGPPAPALPGQSYPAAAVSAVVRAYIEQPRYDGYGFCNLRILGDVSDYYTRKGF